MSKRRSGLRHLALLLHPPRELLGAWHLYHLYAVGDELVDLGWYASRGSLQRVSG